MFQVFSEISEYTLKSEGSHNISQTHDKASSEIWFLTKQWDVLNKSRRVGSLQVKNIGLHKTMLTSTQTVGVCVE